MESVNQTSKFDSLVFHNLYVQTEYNMLSSTLSISKLKNELYKFEGSAISIVDDSMNGVLKFQKALKENENVKSIIGLRCKIYNPNIDNFVLLYAKNESGYKSLMHISSEVQLNPKNVTLGFLKENNEGLIAVIPFVENETHFYYDNKNSEKLTDCLNEYKNTFESLYLGLTLQVTNYSNKALRELMNYSLNLGILSIAINKVCMLKKEHVDAYRVLKCIKNNSQNYDLSELEQNSYFLSNQELQEMYDGMEELIYNQEQLVDECNFEIKSEGYKFPKFPLNEGISARDYLASLCKKGLDMRLKLNAQRFKFNYSDKINIYRDRLLYELDIINKMGYNDYFLIVYDFIKYAKNNDIMIGPGRGSACGSLVCYALGITEIDPIEHGCLFERFLNLYRASMPDIDTDIEDSSAREVLISYLSEKYGQDKTARIIAYSPFTPKVVLRDVIKVVGVNDNKAKEILKYVREDDRHSGLGLNGIIEASPILSKMIDSDEEIKYIFDIAKVLENLPKNTLTHAAGLVIGPSNLMDYIPLTSRLGEIPQTQFEKDEIEEMGLVKMDLLVVDNLRALKDTYRLIKEKHKDFDPRLISVYDKKVYSIFYNVNTTGIFQFDTHAAKRALNVIKPLNFSDLVATMSLDRPGPSEYIQEFSNRKNNHAKFDYIDDSIIDILKPTYGIIIYQEQVMLIANKFAGYTMFEADSLRKAISKKKASIMQAERDKFIDKSVKLGRDKNKAKALFNQIEKFSGYGFNKSHGIAYSMLAFYQAYCKYYYKEAFYSSLLNTASMEKRISYIDECRANGIKVYHPSINKSKATFIYADNAILYPLTGINNVNSQLVEKIIEERSEKPFESFDDFVNRMGELVDKKSVCALIYAGCFDEFKETRKSMMESYDVVNKRSDYINYAAMFSTNVTSRKHSDEEFSFEEISALEREALGFNLKYDMFIKYLPFKQKNRTVDLANLKEGVSSKVFFITKNVKVIKDKNNKDMAFFVACDSGCSYDAVIFSRNYEELHGGLEEGKAYMAMAKLQTQVRNGETKTSLICDNIYVIK